MEYTALDYRKAEADIEYITGMSLIELRDKLAEGYVLQAPKVKYRLCPVCNGTGFVQVALGVREIKPCPECGYKVRYKTR